MSGQPGCEPACRSRHHSRLTACRPLIRKLLYVFLREAYGSSLGFLYGWMNFVIASVGVTIIAAAFAIFLNVVTGGAVAGEILAFNFAGWRIALRAAQVVAVIIIAVVMLVNCAAVSLGGRVATVLTGFKIALVVGIGAGAFVLANGDWANFALSGARGACEGVAESTRGGFAGFGAAMLGALLAYNGWQAIVMLAGKVKNPQIKIRSLTLTVTKIFSNKVRKNFERS